jgi:hypothetical protein
MAYDAFLIERRKLMAAIIRRGFESLKQAPIGRESVSGGSMEEKSAESTESWMAARANSTPTITEDSGAATTDTDDKEGVNTGVAALSAHKQFQLKFWTAFRQYIEAKSNIIGCQKPLPQHWTNHAIGRSGIHLTSIVSIWNSETNSKRPEIRAELYLETALGFPLTWHNPENKAMCRLYARQDADFLSEALWPQHFEWLRQRLETMHKVFAPIVRNLKLEAAD